MGTWNNKIWENIKVSFFLFLIEMLFNFFFSIDKIAAFACSNKGTKSAHCKYSGLNFFVFLCLSFNATKTWCFIFFCKRRTLVQTIYQCPTSHFRLRAAMVEGLPTPLQRRVWTLLCHLLSRRNIQPEGEKGQRGKG